MSGHPVLNVSDKGSVNAHEFSFLRNRANVTGLHAIIAWHCTHCFLNTYNLYNLLFNNVFRFTFSRITTETLPAG